MTYFAWPLCICIAAVIGLLIFKKEISRFIDRTRAVTKDGVVTDAITVQEVKNVVKPSKADELLKSFDNKLLVEQENHITEFLEQQNIHAPSEREKLLIRYLASAYIVNKFESIYHSMWASQFRALEMLNESVPQGIPRQALDAWYEFGKASNPNWYVNYPFELWLGYMKGMMLIGEADDGLFHITNFGNEFLKYLIQNNYSTQHKSG